MVDYIEIPTQARLISIPPYIGKIEGQLICLSNNPEKFNNKNSQLCTKIIFYQSVTNYFFINVP